METVVAMDDRELAREIRSQEFKVTRTMAAFAKMRAARRQAAAEDRDVVEANRALPEEPIGDVVLCGVTDELLIGWRQTAPASRPVDVLLQEIESEGAA